MIVTALLIAAVVLAVVDEVQARGRSLIGWACIVGFGALLLARLT